MSIKFKFVNAPYGFLSNFSPHAVTYEGKLYKTSEALYQALKFNEPSVREVIRACLTPKDAAVYGRTHGGIRSDWDQAKLDVMRMVIRLKVEQHPFIKESLIKTGTEELVEDSNKDTFWGRKPTGEGYNWLGKLWMELRDELVFERKNNEIK